MDSERLVPGQEGKWILHALPVLLSIGMMALRNVINEDPLKGVGADVIFAGLGFDVWAFQTLITGRQVVFGGFHRFPARPGRWTAQHNQWAWVVFLVFVHVFLAFVASSRIAAGESTEVWWFFGAAFLSSLLAPFLLVLGHLPGNDADRYES